MTATISGSAVSTLVALTTTGNTILGDASTNTLNVGNGDLVKDASGNLLVGTTTANGKVTVAGTVGISVNPGTYTFDVSPTGTTIANGGTVNYSNSSGFLIVNNWTQGAVGIWLMGGGATSLVSSTSPVGLGNVAYNSGISGYTWTSTYGSTALYNFVFIRTRPTA